MRVAFPFLLLAQTARFRLIGQSHDVRQGLSGASTVTASLGARWGCTLEMLIKKEGSGLQYQAFIAGMQGQIGTTLVPMVSRYRPQNRDGKNVTRCTVAALRDGQTNEHFGFTSEPVVMARLSKYAALRSTQITLTYGDAVGLRPGQFFSIGGHGYQAQLVWSDGNHDVVQFQPPLRAAAAYNTDVVLDNPVCEMRLASEDDGGFDQLLARMQSVTLNFIEAV